VVMVVTAGTLVIVVLVVMAVTAAAFMVVLMVMAMAAAAFMVVVLVMMVVTAAAFMVVVLMVMVMAAGTFVIMVVLVMMVMTAAAFCPVVMMAMMVVAFLLRGFVPGMNFHLAFHGSGNGNQLRNQGIRVLCRQPQLLGGKGNGGLLHQFVGIEFALNFSGTVGAVQIFNDINLSCHGNASLF